MVIDWLNMTLAVDRAVKPQHKQINKILKAIKGHNSVEKFGENNVY